MIAKEIISLDVPSLSPEDKVKKALEWMDEFKVTHLAVIENEQLKGLVEEQSLYDVSDDNATIEEAMEDMVFSFVSETEHVFEVVKKVSDSNLSLVPVLNERAIYQGAISIHTLMKVIAEMPVVKSPGGIIVLEMSNNDYTMSQIAQIVESNDAKILGSFITRFPESTKMELTLKLNKDDIYPILKSFERYDYRITASYDKTEYKDDLKDRYDHLMRFLKI